MLWQILNNIGFTERESKVYLALLEKPGQPASIVARQAGINRTTTYLILQDLIKKGLATSSTKKSTHYFHPIEPKRIIGLLENKEKDIKSKKHYFVDNIEKLENIQQNSSYKPKVSYYEGFQGVMNLYADTLTAEDKTIHSFIRFDKFPKEILNYLEKNYLPKRKKLKIKAKIITQTPTLLTNWMSEDHQKENLREIKTYDLKLPIQVEVQIYSNKVSFIHLSKETPFGVLIENINIKNTLQAIHQLLWESL